VSTLPSPRLRRIHELANDLGTSSKELLSFAASLGVYVKSASSTIGPAEVDRITMTWRNRADALTRPMPTRTNSPYGSTRRHPATASLTNGAVAEDPQEAAIRRNLGIPHPRASRQQQRRRSTERRPLSAVAAELLRRWPQLHESVAQAHADAWTRELFAEPQEIIAWLDAGYNYDQLGDVKKLHREGITTPALLDAKVGDQTVRKLLRRGEPAHYIARLLRDSGRI
jgi:hypothetical protein